MACPLAWRGLRFAQSDRSPAHSGDLPMTYRLRLFALVTILLSVGCTPRTSAVKIEAPQVEQLPRDTFATPAQTEAVARAAPPAADEAARSKPAEGRITLRKDFIERIKNRACLAIGFQVLGVGGVHSG